VCATDGYVDEGAGKMNIILKVPVKVLVGRYKTAFDQTPISWTHLPDLSSETEKWNPFDPSWDGTPPITKEEIAARLEKDDLSDSGSVKDYHTAHIAYFVKNAISVLQLDLMPPNMARVVNEPTWWEIRDGFHRLAAAEYKGDEFVECGLVWERWQLSQEDIDYIQTELQPIFWYYR
jgi:hypothetical protein